MMRLRREGPLVALAAIAAFLLPPLVAPNVLAAAVVVQRLLDRGDRPSSRFQSKTWVRVTRELPLLAALAGALVFGVSAFFGLLEDVVTGEPIVQLDQFAYGVLQRLREPHMDVLLIAVTELGDSAVVMPVTAAGLAALLVMGRWRAGLLLVTATAGAAVFTGGMKAVIHRPRPVAIYDGVAEYSFPSGHACMSIVLYGMLAFLLAYGAPALWRRRIAFLAMVLISLIAFSRVYLGAHWLSDVLAGLAFGLAWVALLAIVYLHADPPPLPALAFGGVLVATIAVAGAYHMYHDFAREAGRYGLPARTIPKPP